MPETWERWLTEEERGWFNICRQQKLDIGDWLTLSQRAVPGFVRSLAASRALAAAKDEALPLIVFAVYYHDLGDTGHTWDNCRQAWEERFYPALEQEHGGDCTNEPYSCARCQAEDSIRIADIITAALALTESDMLDAGGAEAEQETDAAVASSSEGPVSGGD